jgi:hypothetical protein
MVPLDGHLALVPPVYRRPTGLKYTVHMLFHRDTLWLPTGTDCLGSKSVMLPVDEDCIDDLRARATHRRVGPTLTPARSDKEMLSLHVTTAIASTEQNDCRGSSQAGL